MLVLAFAMPLLADVSVTVAEGTANDEIAEVSLAISGGAVVRGLAVTVTITGANLAAIADVTDVMAGFNAYIDYYYSNTGFLGSLPGETSLPGTGAHCVARADAAGVLTALPATTFSISLGALDNSGNQGGVTAGGLLCKIKLSNFAGATANVCVAPDALRGGIVGDTLGTVTVASCANIAKYVSPDACRAKIATAVPAKLAEYDAYLAAGHTVAQMQCWCWKFQCQGDANHDTQVAGWRVYTNDLAKLSVDWKKLIATANPCADINWDAQVAGWRIYTNDLNKVSTNWKKTDAQLTACASSLE
jgi:hypothetical protein